MPQPPRAARTAASRPSHRRVFALLPSAVCLIAIERTASATAGERSASPWSAAEAVGIGPLHRVIFGLEPAIQGHSSHHLVSRPWMTGTGPTMTQGVVPTQPERLHAGFLELTTSDRQRGNHRIFSTETRTQNNLLKVLLETHAILGHRKARQKGHAWCLIQIVIELPAARSITVIPPQGSVR